ncbi:MAG TPA: glycosyltransferase [Jiangellales bacterium]|nr:glycosyltransferase [Jiangellales bacterium]
MGRPVRVVAVVVAYDRRALLAETLAALGAQTRPADRLVVVDNASTDGSGHLVAERAPEADLVRLTRNTGGAGGFAAGVARAVDEHAADLVWLMDDDSVPEPTALAELLAARDGYPGPAPVVLASRVVWTDGRDHPMNTPRPKPGARAAERRAAAAVGCLPIRSASFVSVLLDAGTVRERGLPVADYFLWNDDFEYTVRLLRGRRGLYCPRSVVTHKTRVFGGTDADPGERFYLEVRNKVWVLTRSRGLAPAERLLYGGATLRRWARTFARSGDRATLGRGLLTGLRDGVRRAPRRTEDVLAEAGLTVHERRP